MERKVRDKGNNGNAIKSGHSSHFLRMDGEIEKNSGAHEFCVSLPNFSPIQTREMDHLSSISLFSISLSPISLKPNKG
jgi:hypothetical protein